MNTEKKNILIVGCGPGSEEYIIPAGRAAALSADVLIVSQRLHSLFPESAAERIDSGNDVEKGLQLIAARRAAGLQVCLLATGDPGIASLAQPVIRRFGRECCVVIPGISSVQVAFARLGLSWQEARIITAHSRNPRGTIEELREAGKIAILGGRPEALSWTAELIEKLDGKRRTFLCEDLTLPSERVREITSAELAKLPTSTRAIILIIKEEAFS